MSVSDEDARSSSAGGYREPGTPAPPGTPQREAPPPVGTETPAEAAPAPKTEAPRPKPPLLARPWLPWSLAVLAAAVAATLTVMGVVDRDEALREVQLADNKTEAAENTLQQFEGTLDELVKERREVAAIWADCRRSSDLVVEFFKRLQNALDDVEAGRIFPALVAFDEAEDAREDLVPEWRVCQRKADRVT